MLLHRLERRQTMLELIIRHRAIGQPLLNGRDIDVCPGLGVGGVCL